MASQPGDFLLAYGVLLIALVLEGVSLPQAIRQRRREARVYDRDLLEHMLATSDPTTRAVFAEDGAAVIGIVIATVGIRTPPGAARTRAGRCRFDSRRRPARRYAVILIDRNRRFLTGEPGSDELREAVVARIQELPDVAEVRFARLVFVGPKRLFLVASVDLVGDPVESHVAHTLRRLEKELEQDPGIQDAVLTIADPDESDR